MKYETTYQLENFVLGTNWEDLPSHVQERIKGCFVDLTAALITGSRSRGLGLLALYLWVALFREIIEPRILGRRVGLRPLVTLMCMYAGARLFGGVGLAALPVMAAILADLNRNGVVRLYRSDGPEPLAAQRVKKSRRGRVLSQNGEQPMFAARVDTGRPQKSICLFRGRYF